VLNDVLYNTLQIPQYILRADPNGPHTLPSQPTIANSVMRYPEMVALIIDFDAELGAIAVEIQHVRTCRVLVAEAETCLFLAQSSP
jgi:hypothetical protein